MAIKRGLGKKLGDIGLNALLDTTSFPTALTQHTETTQIPIEWLKPGQFQPRTHFEPGALAELANSIRTQGIIQPLIVRPIGERQYEIIAGERRWRASQQAGLDTVPVIVRTLDDTTTMAIALIENIQREDLNAIEEATAIEQLIQQCGLTHEAAAQAIGKSRATVSNLLRLLQLAPEVKLMLQNGALNMGHARALAGVPTFEQTKLAQTVVTQQLSVRATEQLIRRHLAGAPKLKAMAPKDPDIQCYESQLANHFGLKVQVNHNGNGGGKIILHYHNVDELQGLLD